MFPFAALMTSRGSFAPVTNTYNASSGIETIPMGGATQVLVEVWGGGGGGGFGDVAGTSGGGGGSGAYSSKAFALVLSDVGLTFNYVAAVGVAAFTTGAQSSCTNGSFGTAANLVCTGGIRGGDGGASDPNQGAGGTASGGTTNTAGNGSGGVTRVGAGAPNGGGNATAGNVGTAPGGGGAGGNFASSGPGLAGGAGRVRYSYT